MVPEVGSSPGSKFLWSFPGHGTFSFKTRAELGTYLPPSVLTFLHLFPTLSLFLNSLISSFLPAPPL